METGPGLLAFAEHPELSVAVTCGTEHWSYGQTRLTVHGSGAVEVDNRRAGHEAHYSGRLERPEVEAFGEEMAELGLTTLSSDRTRYEMGETTVTIEVRDGNNMRHHADLPADDRFSDDRLGRLVEIYETLVSRFTDGALPYGPPVAQ